MFHWNITILWEQLMLFILLGQAELSSSSLTSTSWVECKFRKQYVHIRIIWSYLKEFQGKKNPLLALLSTPNQELLASGMISGAKSIYDLEKENLPVR